MKWMVCLLLTADGASGFALRHFACPSRRTRTRTRTRTRSPPLKGMPEDREELRRDREENDFLAIAAEVGHTRVCLLIPRSRAQAQPQTHLTYINTPTDTQTQMGLVTEDEVDEGRQKVREYDEASGAGPSTDRFGGFMAGLTIGTPLSEESQSSVDESDPLVRLAKRVEERRKALGL